MDNSIKLEHQHTLNEVQTTQNLNEEANLNQEQELVSRTDTAVTIPVMKHENGEDATIGRDVQEGDFDSGDASGYEGSKTFT